MASHSKKVLITGIDGFTGAHLEKRLLSNGYDVYGLTIADKKNKNYMTADLLDRESVKNALQKIKPHYIIHLAAISFLKHPDPMDFYKVNIFGALNLLESILEQKFNLKNIIIASSANIYGNIQSDLIDETMKPDPISHYALSKYAMEQMTKNYFNDIKIIITRHFNYTGAGQSDNFLVPKIVNHFKEKKETIELGNTDIARDFSDVRDVAKAYEILLSSADDSGIYNICSSEAVTLKQIICICGDITGHKIKIKSNPEYSRENEIKILKGSNSKIKKLGYIPEYSIEDTLKWMITSKQS